MLNEEQVQLTTSAPSFWRRMTRFLFEPHPSITEVGARRQARLVSIIAILITLTNSIGAVTLFLVVKETIAGVVLIGLTAIAVLGYGLSRTTHYKVGGYTIVWTLALAAFGRAFSSDSPSTALYIQLIPALVIASITFSFRYMTFFTVLSNLTIGLLPFVIPEYTNVGTDLAVFIPLSVLTLASMRYREGVERDRLAEVQQINRDLSSLSSELEQRVAERTAKLEERARQLQAVTEVARSAASVQQLEQLLSDSAHLISQNFGFYHVGIFLLDENEELAVLRAANSEGGKRMLARQHSLPINRNSIVGYTAKTQMPRIALDTGADAVYFDNPDLPETRSEMAVPLKIGARLIGVLDVQSTEKDAFSQDDIAIIGTLGDQLVVAMENARLLNEARQALATAEVTYQRFYNQAWSQFSKQREREGYVYHNGKVIPVSEKSNGNDNDGKSTLRIPLRVRGQEIGTLEVQPKNGKRDWSTNERALLESAAERAALALESARLLEEAQRRAAREQAIGDMTASISVASDIDMILRTAIQELGNKLGNTEVIFELGTEQVAQ